MRIACSMLLLGIILTPLVAQPVAQPIVPPVVKPTKAQIDRWVTDLGAEDFDARELATRKLWEAGNAAEEAVNAATSSKDAEIARRAREIADKFRFGIYPDTPQAIVAAVGRYQGGDNNAKIEAVRELLDSGTPGCRALVRITKAENAAEVKQQILGMVSNELSRSIPDLLASKNHDLLADLLEIALDDSNNGGTARQNYAAYWLLSGKLDQRIAHHKALLVKNKDDKRGHELLALLYRAANNYKDAVASAIKANNPELVDNLLYESGNWKELVARGTEVRQGDAIESLAFRTAYARLAGDTRTYDALIGELKKEIEELKAEDERIYQVAKGLFLNDRPDLGFEVLAKGPHWVDRMQLMLAQLRYKEAFALADKAREAKVPQLPQIELLEARTLHALGEKEKAGKLFAKYADQIKPDNDVSWLENLVEAEAKVGLRDKAMEHTAKILAFSNDQGWPNRLLGKIFPGKSEIAEPLWIFLRQRHAGQDSLVTLKLLRDMLDGKYPANLLQAMAKGAPDALKDIAPVDRQRASLALAEIYRAHNETKLAIDLLEEVKTQKSVQMIGDILYGNKQYTEAAEKYRAAFDLNRQTPVPLYLSGLALEKAGKTDEGKALIEQAHWLSLGREEVRYEFVRELAKRGHDKALAREVELMRRTSQPGDYYAGEAVRREALAALVRRDYATAAAAHEMAMLRCLRSYINFLDKGAYVGVPAMIHPQRAAGMIQAGKEPEARAEIDLAFAMTPGPVEGTIRLVQVLDRAGKKKEADAIFERGISEYRKLTKEYPNCAYAHNSTAWICATCKRDLTTAKAVAEKAIELDPESAGYRDTLAEILFQMGEKDRAIEVQKRVIEMSPKRQYFKKQLARIQAGDKNADMPPEEDGDEDDDE